MNILQRTIKIVGATLLATRLAQILGLEFATAAGVIAILSILDTRRATLKVAWQRLLSTLLALALASISFSLLGFNLWALGLFLVLYAPLAYRWDLAVGLTPSTVLVTHLLSKTSLAPQLLLNELGLFVIGALVAMAFNLYMPSRSREIAQIHHEVEELLRDILLRFGDFLLTGDGRNEGLLIQELDQTLSRARKLVYQERHNQVFYQTNQEVLYFDMRLAQKRILANIAEDMNTFHCQSDEGEILAVLFEQVALQISKDNPATQLLAEIANYRQLFRQRDLPQTREEFETRALLFQVLKDLENFIQLKVDYYQDEKKRK